MGAVFALFAAWYFWTPKAEGLTYNDKKGRLHFWGLFIGVNLTFLPMRAVYELSKRYFVLILSIGNYLSITFILKGESYFITFMRAFAIWSYILFVHTSNFVDTLDQEEINYNHKKLSSNHKHNDISSVYDTFNELNRVVEDKNKWTQQITIDIILNQLRPLDNRRNNQIRLKGIKIFTPIDINFVRLDAFNRSMVNCRKFSTKLDKDQRSLKNGETDLTKIEPILEKNSLTNICVNLLQKSIWPATESIFKNVKEYIFIEQTKLATKSANLYKKYKGERENIFKDPEFKNILEQTDEFLSSILWKILAVELLSCNSGSTTPGTDNKNFTTVSAKLQSKNSAVKRLEKNVIYLKKEINLSKGKTDQSIRRKGLSKLNEREVQKIIYKTPKGKILIKNMNTELKMIKQDPLNYYNKQIENNRNKNITLKFELLKSLQFDKLMKYKADPIKSIEIPKGKGKIRILGIPTLKDRVLQMLIKLILEPILEPMGDPHSFGFRPGRGCQMAVTCVANRTTWNRRGGGNRIRAIAFGKSKSLSKLVSNEQFYNEYHIIDADIKGCFDNISHEWLLKNVPMPIRYAHLLKEILKSPRLEMDGKTITITSNGVPQGGIISPLLMNWTLDGLEQLINNIRTNTKLESSPWKGTFISVKKKKHLSNKINLKELENSSRRGHQLKVMSRTCAWFVRYADDFIIGVNTNELIPFMMKSIKEFLAERGLQLSDEKTHIIPWKLGEKFDFLSWTFHLIRSNKVNWINKAPKQVRGHLTDWMGLYVCPSRKATAHLRSQIKEITSIKNTHKSVGDVVMELGSVIRGWSNYFIGGKQSSLRVTLDWFITKRTRMFLWKKYGQSMYGTVLQKYRKHNNQWYPLHVKTVSGGMQAIPTLYKMIKDISWYQLEISKQILNNSFLINKKWYLIRKTKISKLLNELHGNLYHTQKGICSICNKDLFNDTTLDLYEDQFIYDKNNMIIQDSSLNNIDGKVYGPDLISEKFDQFKNNLIKGQKWYYNLHVDHIVPEILGKSIPFKNILRDIQNKQLIHKDCHVFIKTHRDTKILNIFKNIINKHLKIINKKIKTCTIQELFMINKLSIIDFLNTEEVKTYFNNNKRANYIFKKLLKIKEYTNIMSSRQKYKRPESHRLKNIRKIQIRKSQNSRK